MVGFFCQLGCPFILNSQRCLVKFALQVILIRRKRVKLLLGVSLQHLKSSARDSYKVVCKVKNYTHLMA